jgi:hypothetical protein
LSVYYLGMRFEDRFPLLLTYLFNVCRRDYCKSPIVVR